MRLLLSVPLMLSLFALATDAAAQTLPVADAGDDFSEECADANGTSVTLDGSDSFDPDDYALTYTWTSASLDQPANGDMPSVELPPGVHTIVLTVDDGVDGIDMDEVVVTIEDTTAPVIELSDMEPIELWPPNHKYRRVEVDGFIESIEDACDGDLSEDDFEIFEATSDEPENDKADGDTLDDIVLVEDCGALALRAERQGKGNGRVYNAEIGVRDANGNESSEVVRVAYVPKSQSDRFADAVDDGAAYSVDECVASIDLCPVEPADDCTEGTSAQLRLKRKPDSDGDGNKLRWKLRGIDSDLVDFGDPTADTDYELCIYTDDDGDADLVSDPGAAAGDGWTSKGEGFRFRQDKDGLGEGIDRAKLRAGDNANGSIRVRAKGAGAGVPDLPVPDGVDLVVQLHNSEGACWTSEFSDPKKNDSRVYKARTD